MLEHAADLIDGDRNHTYGSPTQNFQNIAEMWNVRFKHMLKDDVSFSASDVADAQIIVKVARGIANKTSDTYTDIAGYAACGHEIEFGDPAQTEAVVTDKPYDIDVTVLAPPGGLSPTEAARLLAEDIRRRHRGMQ